MQKQQNLEEIRHSLSHLMSMAIMELDPKIGLGVGPCIDNGFYQDYGTKKTISADMFPKLEKRIKKMIKSNIEFKQHDVDVKEALEFYKHDPYKTEMIEELAKKGNKTVSFYKSDWFDNLCAGPHVKSTKEIDPNAFKLTKVAGAYWRGDEKNTMLQRIYGVAFESKEKLDKHLELLEEAEKRDHRKIGKEQNLFMFSKHGPGFPIFLNNGLIIWDELLKYWRQVHSNYGYKEIKTPILFNKSLWEKSGHWDYYRENMYISEVEKEKYVIKPMNCPGGMLAYKNEMHSYKDFPLKVGEIGQVHRHEKSGVLSGLFRVRSFHQDDAHIYMMEDQIVDQVLEVLKITDEIYATFGLKYHLELSTKPKKHIGSDKDWKFTTSKLEEALKKSKKKYEINEGDGAFYGPKIDVHLEDALGRTWQCATIQVDMSLPEKFDLTYIDAKGNKQRPIMIHRTIYGAIERFLAVIIEHYGGAFPLWLSPVQISIISVGSEHKKHCEKLAEDFKQEGFRVELDLENETVGNKIRKAINQKTPYMLVIGDKEIESKDLMVRVRGEQKEKKISKQKFIDNLKKEILNKK